ncbi:type IV pilus assembly protein PilM [Heliophilum fasciatum]|uniref:Type IV pilus assembly protein PilM n=1 Tax=Heliophilum fasciatum TaxID=35700 RepID=A0A4R2RWJ8_9FIRM|nr:type IV pilus assembly protein PilM [Heliophilum fasciatum]MCW2277290.1 type IV pilus assembly protein PilM [Heliophilum fasciatum]TCP67127.1 type IV pilus assembly protein PilM [Heliophilum fasciatum]
MFRKQRLLLGVEYGETAVRMVLTEWQKDQFQLIGVAMAPLPMGDVEHTPDEERKQEINKALNACLQQLGIKGGKVNFSFAPKNLITRVVRLPEMPKEEMRAALRWELEKYIPDSVEHYVYDFTQHGREDLEEGPMVRLLLVAVPQEEVKGFLPGLKKAGLQAVSVETASYALARLVLSKGDKARPGTLLELGESRSMLTVVRDHAVQFIRSIPIGTLQLEESLAEISGMAREQVRERIRSGALFTHLDLSLADEVAMEDSLDAALQAKAVRAFLTELVSEVQRSIDYFRLQVREQLDLQLTVAGELANHPKLAPWMAANLDVAVAPIDLGGLLGERSTAKCHGELRPEMAVAVGLATRKGLL